MLLADELPLETNTKSLLVDAWTEGVNAVKGDACVLKVLENNLIEPPDVVISVGKAASSMALGARNWFQAQIAQLIVVTKYEHVDAQLLNFENTTIIEAGHPLPDEASLKAGDLIQNCIKNMPKSSKLLFLVSGGASSLVEKLMDDFGLEYLQNINENLLSNGAPIEQVNAERAKYSQIKNGGLLKDFGGKVLDVIYISDVQGDSLETIGSGIASPHLLENKTQKCSIKTHLAGSNKIARMATEDYFKARGYTVITNEEALYDDVFELSKSIANQIIFGNTGVYIVGGEPTISLPKSPGRGGRNQSLALAIAKEIQGTPNITCLVGGTDGTDGPTSAAGGLVDGETFDDILYATDCLDKANAGEYLEKQNNLFVSGVTGTNVMDILIAIKE